MFAISPDKNEQNRPILLLNSIFRVILPSQNCAYEISQAYSRQLWQGARLAKRRMLKATLDDEYRKQLIRLL